MPHKEFFHTVELDFSGKPLKPVHCVTGATHHFIFKSPILILDHQYHDDTPVGNAEYQVELENGTQVTGSLNNLGKAEIRELSSKPVRVRFGLDPNPYSVVDDAKNPDYLEHFSRAEANALTTQGSNTSAESETKSLGIAAVEWIWGTVKGGFNDKQTVSQIIVDACIGIIPLVGDVTAVRDLLALILAMARDPKKREEKLEWLALVVLLFALIPVFGGALKGIGKLLLRSTKNAPEAGKQLKGIIAFLNRIGIGNSLKWLKDLNLEVYTGEVQGRWRELTYRLDLVLEKIVTKFAGIFPASMLNHLAHLRTEIKKLALKGESMIPDAINELWERLKSTQRELYQGEWHEIPKSLNSSTREVEARLVDTPSGKKWEVEKMHFPQNGRDHFTKREDWPDLSSGKYVQVTDPNNIIYKVIPCFSGPIRAVKIMLPQKIYRVISKNGNAAGEWWVYTLPESGKEWREGLAVLDSWNKNGYYVELQVPDDGLWAWEGKAASQVENDTDASTTLGQYLPGGFEQLFIDMKHLQNKISLEKYSKKRNATIEKILEKKPTEWADSYSGLHVPRKHTEPEFLGPFELERKNQLKATALEKSTRKDRQQI